jgi:ATP-dependent RNA helicase SUPV3L1/SUV3
MEEEGSGSVENDLPVAEPQPRHDFSHVQGFQVVGAEDLRSERAADEAWREALRLELETRAERLRQSVDAAIVLSNDGIIRWLGDPVAKLSVGPNVLNPSAVILADDSLPDESRVTIKTRIELWIAATTRRLLAPLFALEGVQEGSEIVRDLAHELVRSLGVLEREPIKAKIRTLTQDDRAELRKQGVRFGAYYLFFPTLLKPAARGLALQLWALQASGDADELLRTLGPIGSSGRTSLPTDKAIGKEGYRVAGYRACGERIVRVDVVERLAGMIRSAIVGEAPGGADGVLRQRPGKGFVISGAMTSLTGCAGEPFASILRSMGFRSVEMKRSEFFGPQSVGAVAQPGASPEPAENRPPTDEQTPPPASDEVAAEPALAAPLTEPPSHGAEGLDGAAAGSERVSEDTDAVAEAVAETAEDDDAAAEAADGTPEDDAAVADDADRAPEDDDVGEGAHAASEGVDSAAEGADHAAADTASAVSDPLDSAPTADGNAQAAARPRTPGATDEAAKDADLIIVWRPDHRKTSPRREREGKRPRSEGHGRLEAPSAPAAAPNWRRDPAARPPRRPNPANSPAADEKRRPRPKDYDMSRSTPPAAPQQKTKVDPNSPFAKLLELRSLLEEQANKRR